MRFHPLILKVREMIAAGAAGEIRLLAAEFGYPTPFDPESRFFNRQLAGGALLDRGVYLLSLASFLLGPAREAIGRGAIGPTGVDEQDFLLLTFHSGAQAMLAASLRSRLSNEARIIGTRGQIRIHEPFYAPHHVTFTPLIEPAAPGPGSLPARESSGWKQRIERNPLLRRAFDSLGRPTLHLIRPKGQSLVYYGHGQGYQFEAAEVMRCLRAALLESPLMPLDESLAILKTTDELRRSWGLRLGDESG